VFLELLELYSRSCPSRITRHFDLTHLGINEKRTDLGGPDSIYEWTRHDPLPTLMPAVCYGTDAIGVHPAGGRTDPPRYGVEETLYIDDLHGCVHVVWYNAMIASS